MNKENFEKLISEHSDLNKFLNENEIIGFSDFSKLDFNNKDFITYIEKRYTNSFKSIYKKYTEESPNYIKVNALLRSLDYLGNSNVIKAIEADLNNLLNTSLEILQKNKIISDDDVKKINPKELLKAVDVTIINIFNKAKPSSLIDKTKDEIIAHLLYINYKLKDLDPRYYRDLYMANEEILEKLKKIEGYDSSQKSKYLGFSAPKALKNESPYKDKPILEVKKDKKYWIYIIGIIILLLKVCSRI